MAERDVDWEVVDCLVRSQFPQWADLQLRPVLTPGWDNTTFRLGEHLSVRLPNDDALVAQVDKECRWLPLIADHVTVPISTPVGRGQPGCGFTRPWSINLWLPGEPAGSASIEDLDQLAVDLAGFLAELQATPIHEAPQPGVHNYHRGGRLAVFDHECREAIESLAGRIDVDGALAVWDTAIHATSDRRVVWVHGDITGSNLLVADGRLVAVIDFGCCAVGDPSCDLGVAWTLFDGASRMLFMATVTADSSTWSRARGWTLWKAVKGLAMHSDDHPRNDGTRLGWRRTSRQVIADLIVDDQ